MFSKYSFVKCALVLSILVNFVFVIPYWNILDHPKLRRHFSSETPDSEVIYQVVKYSLNHENSIMIQNEYRGLPFDIINFFSPTRNSDVKNNYYIAYYYAGISQYAFVTKDSIALYSLINKAADWVVGDTLNYEIKRIDQIPIGLFFINLYKSTHEEKYKKVSKWLYTKLLDFRVNDGNLIPYNTPGANVSDAIGMYVPFLVEYYKNISSDSLALHIAKDNIEEFYKYGVDKETGIPMHGYVLDSKIKVGSANWGRGIGWYLLAYSFLGNCNISDSLLNKNIATMKYHQFPFYSSHFDSSTAIMFEIFKNRLCKKTINLSFIKTHITEEGVVDDFSGDTYGLNNYSHNFGRSELGNGLLLLLYYRFNRKFSKSESSFLH